MLAQKRSQVDLSVTDPYFLDRNLVAGFDLFHISNDNQDIASYSERRTGGALRLGYVFNEHLSQAWTYTLVSRNVYNVQSGASIYVLDQQGESLLSQLGTTVSLDYRDSRVDPHDGFLVRAGHRLRRHRRHGALPALEARRQLLHPARAPDRRRGLDASRSPAGIGYLAQLGHQEKIIDRFFLGGDNLRGFQSGGAGPHALGTTTIDSIGGRFIYTGTGRIALPAADLARPRHLGPGLCRYRLAFGGDR